MRVRTDGLTHRQTQTEFIICPMLYAVAMGQIKTRSSRLVNVLSQAKTNAGYVTTLASVIFY